MVEAEETKGGKGKFGGLLLPLGLIGLYFAMQLWILPAAGVPT